MERVGHRARGDAERDPVSARDRELLDQNAARLREADLPHGDASNHDRQGLHAGVSPLRGHNRHERRGERPAVNRALEQPDHAGAEAGREEVQSEPGKTPFDRASG